MNKNSLKTEEKILLASYALLIIAYSTMFYVKYKAKH